ADDPGLQPARRRAPGRARRALGPVRTNRGSAFDVKACGHCETPRRQAWGRRETPIVKAPFRRLLMSVVAAGVAGAVLVAAGSGAKAKSAVSRGGTLNVGWEQSFGFTDGFDPTGEYLGDAQGIYNNLMLRMLVGYKHLPGGPGNQVVPDAASSLPKPTNGGKTYTFHLRSGLKFGPPVNRAITSKDYLYAMERLAKPKNGAQYAFYYSVIKGFDAYGAGKAKSISGIKTPNDSTIVFNLTKPTGDFLYRMSMPATGPIPPEVGKC